MGTLLTRRQIANKFNVSPQRIDELVKEGRLKLVDSKIDEDQAQAVWDAMSAARVQGERVAKLARAETPDGKPAVDDAGKVADLNAARVYNQAKARRAVIEAQTSELRFKEASGRLVDRDRVKAEAYSAGKILATRLENLPRRVAPMLAPIKDAREIAEILTKEMSDIVNEVRDALAAI